MPSCPALVPVAMREVANKGRTVHDRQGAKQVRWKKSTTKKMVLFARMVNLKTPTFTSLGSHPFFFFFFFWKAKDQIDHPLPLQSLQPSSSKSPGLFPQVDGGVPQTGLGRTDSLRIVLSPFMMMTTSAVRVCPVLRALVARCARNCR